MVPTKGKNFTKEKDCLIRVLGFNKEHLYDELKYLQFLSSDLTWFLRTELQWSARGGITT